MSRARQDSMRIDVRNPERQRLFTTEVDRPRLTPALTDPAGKHPDVPLDWTGALDDKANLRRCPLCGCRELFVRKDFPQAIGLAVVVAAAAGAVALFVLNRPTLAYLLLAAMVLVDAGVYLLAGRRLVCYRCRSEFIGAEIAPDQAGWDLAVGEKYRPGRS